MFKCSYCPFHDGFKWIVDEHVYIAHGVRTDMSPRGEIPRRPIKLRVGPDGGRAPTTISVPPIKRYGAQSGMGVEYEYGESEHGDTDEETVDDNEEETVDEEEQGEEKLDVEDSDHADTDEETVDDEKMNTLFQFQMITLYYQHPSHHHHPLFPQIHLQIVHYHHLRFLHQYPHVRIHCLHILKRVYILAV